MLLLLAVASAHARGPEVCNSVLAIQATRQTESQYASQGTEFSESQLCSTLREYRENDYSSKGSADLGVDYKFFGLDASGSMEQRKRNVDTLETLYCGGTRDLEQAQVARALKETELDRGVITAWESCIETVTRASGLVAGSFHTDESGNVNLDIVSVGGDARARPLQYNEKELSCTLNGVYFGPDFLSKKRAVREASCTVLAGREHDTAQCVDTGELRLMQSENYNVDCNRVGRANDAPGEVRRPETTITISSSSNSISYTVPSTYNPPPPGFVAEEAVEQQLQALKYEVELKSPPVGTVIAYIGPADSLPAGWLLCDGQTYAREEYPELAELLVQPSDDQFTVPNLSGQFLRGAGNDANLLVAQTWTTGAPRGGLALSSEGHRHAIPSSQQNGNQWALSTAGKGGTRASEHHGRSTDPQAHSHSISGFDSETRPDNVQVHFVVYAGDSPGV